MMTSLGQLYLESVIKRLLTYRQLGEGTFAQLKEEDFHFVPASPPMSPATSSATAPMAASNSIAVIIRHLHGNMISRWTNFLTEDGEKEGRNRDMEFSPPPGGKEELISLWDKGWNCLLDTLRSLKETDLLATITIRHEHLVAIDAINRQLAHYPYHVGQIVYIGKMIRGNAWQSLSIPRGASHQFNQDMESRHTR
jgi:hypothetical protein